MHSDMDSAYQSHRLDRAAVLRRKSMLADTEDMRDRVESLTTLDNHRRGWDSAAAELELVNSLAAGFGRLLALSRQADDRQTRQSSPG